MITQPPTTTLFPYTTLFRSPTLSEVAPKPKRPGSDKAHELRLAERMARLGTETAFEVLVKAKALEAKGRDIVHLEIGDRKSTRLNSSHVSISYAVFCLKKKT